MSELLTIACDESGSEGENLTASKHPVFVHASVAISLEEATELVANLRAATRTQAPELKSRFALAPSNRAALLEAMSALDSQGNIHLVDKSYFVTAKMIALLLVDPILDSGGWPEIDPRELADSLHQYGAMAVGQERWDRLLSTFNSLVRSYLRKDGPEPPTVQPFFAALDEALHHCTDANINETLELLSFARNRVREYQGARRVQLREIDPMGPSLDAAARAWQMRIGDVPFEFLVDNYSGLTPEVREMILDGARMPVNIGWIVRPGVDLRAIRLIDSKLDVRVQMADILAGVGREIARLAIDGTFDDELQDVVSEMLDYNVMASAGSALDRLVELRPLQYKKAWEALNGLG